MDPFNQQPTAFLIRKKSQERILLAKPDFCIGRDRSFVDYCILDNTSVSRSHARILFKNCAYFIVDCNSVNHTYVNGQLIPPGKECVLRSGDTIRMANEDFLFVITAAASAAPAPSRPAPPRPASPMPVPPAPMAARQAAPAPARRGLFSAFRKPASKPQPAPPMPASRPAPAPTFTPPASAPQPVSFSPAPPRPAPAPSYAPPTQARIDQVQFSAIAPQTAVKGEYTLVQLFMYEQAFRHAVDEALAMSDGPMQEKKSGFYQVKDNTRVKVVLTSPDVEILDDTAEEIWNGGYLSFDFALDIPQDAVKKQILLKAAVYFNDIPATRLMMTLRLQSQHEQRMEVLRSDVLSAFVSYASQDRARVGGLIQGMKKARPDMDIFFDVNSLRSGDDWEATLRREVERRDILFLCWSKHASTSPWVDMEWRYALQNKGIECIEPIPIDPPDVCPPPQELQSKHFNDSLLYIINR